MSLRPYTSVSSLRSPSSPANVSSSFLYSRRSFASPSLAPSAVTSSDGSIFRQNDKVRVVVNPQELELMQKDHGGYIPEMARFCSKIGYVHRITVNGDLRVKFGLNFDSYRFTFNPDALELVFFKGDIVQVISDVEQIKKIHGDEGKATLCAEKIASKSGRVINIGSNKVEVEISHQSYWINHACIILKESNNLVFRSVIQANCLDEETEDSLFILSEAEAKSNPKSAEQIQEIYDMFTCAICLDELRRIIFLCGHGVCAGCSKELACCPMCREPITRKIQLF